MQEKLFKKSGTEKKGKTTNWVSTRDARVVVLGPLKSVLRRVS